MEGKIATHEFYIIHHLFFQQVMEHLRQLTKPHITSALPTPFGAVPVDATPSANWIQLLLV
jgi:hypothetical protein